MAHGVSTRIQERSGKSDGASQHDVTQEQMNCIFGDLIAFCRISLPFVISGAKKIRRLML